MTELHGAVSDMNDLLRGLSELTRLESDAARAAWVGRNYQNVLSTSKSLSGKLLKVFRKSVRRRFSCTISSCSLAAVFIR